MAPETPVPATQVSITTADNAGAVTGINNGLILVQRFGGDLAYERARGAAPLLQSLSGVSLAGNVIAFATLSISITKRGLQSLGGSKSMADDFPPGIAKAFENLCIILQRDSIAAPKNDTSSAEKEICQLAKECSQMSPKIRDLLQFIQKDKSDPSNSVRTLNAATATRNIKRLYSQICRQDSRCRQVLGDLVRQQSSSTAASNHLPQLPPPQISEEDPFEVDLAFGPIADFLNSRRSKVAFESEDTRQLLDCTDFLLARAEKSALWTRLLCSLRYDDINERKTNLRPKHGDTYEWIFDDDHACKPVYLRAWLEEAQESAFWISGKAGSGKSTLMNFLAGSPKTAKLLDRWRSEKLLITGSFFFWNAAPSSLPKSLTGLLRSLLYDIFRQRPSLISCLPLDIQESLGTMQDVIWTEQVLVFLLSAALVEQQEELCFFFTIDGLDEYDGLSADLIDSLEQIFQSSNAKLCLASRPWPQFEKSFGRNKSNMLVIHEHTADDIREYAEQTLLDDRFFANQFKQANSARKITELIVANASGVFLWVYLVIRKLRETFPMEPSFEDIAGFVEKFPKDLKTYYLSMLERIPELFQSESARIILMHIYARGPLPVLVYDLTGDRNFDERNHGEFDGKPKSPSRPTSDADCVMSLEMKMLSFSKKLRGICLDLVDVHPLKGASHSYRLTDGGISFPHRTTYDFMLQTDVLKLLYGRAGQDFVPQLQICRQLVHLMEEATVSSDGLVYVLHKLSEALMMHIPACISKHRVETCSLLETAGKIIEGLPSDLREEFSERFLSGPAVSCRSELMFIRALQSGILEFVEHRISREASLIKVVDGCSSLALAMRRGDYRQTIPIIKFLLEKGADPRATEKLTETPWKYFINHCIRLVARSSSILEPEEQAVIANVAQLMNKHGVDLSWQYTLKRTKLRPERPTHSLYSHAITYDPKATDGKMTADAILAELCSREQMSAIRAAKPSSVWGFWGWK